MLRNSTLSILTIFHSLVDKVKDSVICFQWTLQEYSSYNNDLLLENVNFISEYNHFFFPTFSYNYNFYIYRFVKLQFYLVVFFLFFFFLIYTPINTSQNTFHSGPNALLFKWTYSAFPSFLIKVLLHETVPLWVKGDLTSMKSVKLKRISKDYFKKWLIQSRSNRIHE